MRLRDEDGQAMILALGFLVFFGLIIGVMLTFANASVLGSERLREQRDVVYAADGATDGAIQYARSVAGRDSGVGAFGRVPCVTFSATLNGVTATVSCTSLADPTDFNRKVQFMATVAGSGSGSSACPGLPADVRVVAVAYFHDRAASLTQDSDIAIQSWTYCR